MKAIAVLAGAGGVAALAGAASAGIVNGSGSAVLWGHSYQYTTWNVYQDPAVFVGVEPVEGRPRGMAFYNGALYVVGAGSMIDTGPVRYAPGAAGNLSSPTTIRTPLQPSDPRRWLKARSIAINTGGAGYGAFSGAEPVLTTIASDQSVNSYSVTLGVSGSTATPGAAVAFSPIAPTSIEYAPSIDRFISATVAAQPAVTTFGVHTHNASGMAALERSFTGVGGIHGMDVVSGAFAGALLGVPVAQSEVILAFGHNDVGLSDPAFLTAYTLEGAQLGTIGSLALAPLVNASSLAVDEAGGNIYLGDAETATITVLHVPAPGAVGLLACAAGLGARRRRG